MAKTTKKKAVKVESISLDEVKALAQNEIDPVYLIDLTNIDEPHAMARLESIPIRLRRLHSLFQKSDYFSRYSCVKQGTVMRLSRVIVDS